MMTLPFLFLLVWLFPSATTQAQAQDDCKACLFDGNDSSDCIVYGKLDDVMIEWSTGSRECKGYYQIAISSIDPTTSCQSVNAFINSIRFGDLQSSDSKLGLGAATDGGAFFVQTGNSADPIGLADAIVIDGETTNCKESPQNCYTAMNAYFSQDDDGVKEMNQVCETLVNKVRLDRNLEESTLRIRICMELAEGNIVPLECNPLAVQIGDLRQEYPDQDCSGYGFETPLTSVPGCETVLQESSSSSGTTSSTTTTTTTTNNNNNSGASRAIAATNIQAMTFLLGAVGVAFSRF